MKNAKVLISSGYAGQYTREFEPRAKGGWLHISGVGKFWVNKTPQGYNIHGKNCASLEEVVKYAEENLIPGNY